MGLGPFILIRDFGRPKVRNWENIFRCLYAKRVYICELESFTPLECLYLFKSYTCVINFEEEEAYQKGPVKENHLKKIVS